MFRYFTAQNTLRYVDVLQPLIHTYNHAYHQSIGMARHQVTPKTVPEVWDRLYGQRLDQKAPPPPQMSSGRSRPPQQETSALRKRLSTVTYENTTHPTDPSNRTDMNWKGEHYAGTQPTDLTRELMDQMYQVQNKRLHPSRMVE